jgi:hypothetical protein
MKRRLIQWMQNDRVLLHAVTLLVACVYAFQFGGPTGYDYYPGVISNPAAALSGKPVECVPMCDLREDGTTATVWDLLGRDFEPLYVDQRIGQPLLLAPFYLLLGPLGFRVAYALWHAGLFLVTFFLVRRVSGSRLASYVAGLAVVFNPFMLGIRELNPNLETGVLAAATLLLLGSASSRARLVMAGVAAGFLFLVAHAIIAVLALPSFIWAAVAGRGMPRRQRAVRGALFAAGALPAMVLAAGLMRLLPAPLPLPIHVCVGDTTVLDASEDQFTRQMVHATSGATPAPGNLCDRDYIGWHRHTLGPVTISIWGMLNWPFYDKVVRSPGVPFPFALFIFFLSLSCFGLLFAAFFPLGVADAVASAAREPLLFALLLLLVCWFLFLAVQENLPGTAKLTYATLCFVPFAIVSAAAFGRLLRAPGLCRAASYVLALAALWGASMCGARAEFPMDPRWQGRLAWKGIGDCMAEADRSRVDLLRFELTRASLLPAADLDLLFSQWDLPGKRGGELAQELGPSGSVPSELSRLVMGAVQSAPAGSKVVINPYAAPPVDALADTGRCVERAPILKPKFYFDFSQGDGPGHTADPGLSNVTYYVDIPSIPTLPASAGSGVRPFYFNGYCTVHRIEEQEGTEERP